MSRPKRGRHRHAPELAEDASDIEKERRTIQVLERILKEREEMLALHEEKVVALKAEYEKKLGQVKAKEKELGDAEKKFRHLSSHKMDAMKNLEKLQSNEMQLHEEVKQLEDKVAKLRDTDIKLQHEISSKHKDVKEQQKRFERMHRAIEDLDKKRSKIQSDIETLEYRQGMLQHEVRDLAQQTRTERSRRDSLASELTHSTVKEINVLAIRIRDHLRHSDFEKARMDYDRIRQMYSYLSSSEKKKVYRKISRLAHAMA